VSPNLNGLAPGTYSGEVILTGSGTGAGTGSGNTMVVFAFANVYGGVQLGDEDDFLRFSARAGDSAPPAQMVAVILQCFYTGCPAGGVPTSIPLAASVSTSDGGNWLIAVPASNSVSVTVNPAGLAPGNYFGAITLTSSTASGATGIPVLFTVWSGSVPALSAIPSSFFSLWPLGASVSTNFCVSAGSSAATIAAQASTLDGSDWLTVTLTDPVTYTCGLIAALDGSNLAPGTYHGNIVVTIPDQSLTIPVTLVVLPPSLPPLIGSVVNGASAIQGPVAPGQIVSIFGVGIGPLATYPAPAQVLFDQAPAGLLYTSTGQINAVVPFGVAGNSMTNVQVLYGGQSTAWTIPVAAASPAIFTLDSSGQGAAAVLNQDNSVNSPTNPAARGSVIQIFGTGVDPLKASAPVSVTIGGVSAVVEYAGPAPGTSGELYQVNALVPIGVAPGAAVPIVSSVGSFQSQPGVTVAVE
jgi:uncharacterized protein (TIGR03437 family)